MTEDQITGLFTESFGAAAGTAPAPIREHVMFEELSFMRREAQAEAQLAYQDWSQHPSRDTCAVYRAAQDRADAAQDALADWVHHHW